MKKATYLNRDEVDATLVQPIVTRLPACPGDLQIGDYVFATRWSDADWNDPWCVGFVAECGKNYVTLCEENGSPISGVGKYAFRYAMKITAEQGNRIVREYSPREGSPFDSEMASTIVFDL